MTDMPYTIPDDAYDPLTADFAPEPMEDPDGVDDTPIDREAEAAEWRIIDPENRIARLAAIGPPSPGGARDGSE